MAAAHDILEERLSAVDPTWRDLAREAAAVLDGNFDGAMTRPSPVLYPHQWSWDAAFVAIGYARFDQARAIGELETLLRGQWADGLVPHIVFANGVDGYFPEPAVWETVRSVAAPSFPATSGIVQPPVHGSALRAIVDHAADRPGAVAAAARLLPRVARWHRFLVERHSRAGDGLLEIWHPWESGMDNSPIWDDPLAAVAPTTTRYRRKDLAVASEEERPGDADYDRYVALLEHFRDRAWHPRTIIADTPFAVADVLFNALFVRSCQDLAVVAEAAGEDPTPYLADARRTSTAMRRRLHDPDTGTFRDLDLRTGRFLATPAAVAALAVEITDAPVTDRLVERLGVTAVPAGDGAVLPSVAVDDPAFHPTRYWRGPVWINLNWLLWRGLRAVGLTDRAEELRRGILHLACRAGFYEHYHPSTGKGHGAPRFAWSAALVIDLLLAG